MFYEYLHIDEIGSIFVSTYYFLGNNRPVIIDSHKGSTLIVFSELGSPKFFKCIKTHGVFSIVLISFITQDFLYGSLLSQNKIWFRRKVIG